MKYTVEDGLPPAIKRQSQSRRYRRRTDANLSKYADLYQSLGPGRCVVFNGKEQAVTFYNSLRDHIKRHRRLWTAQIRTNCADGKHRVCVVAKK